MVAAAAAAAAALLAATAGCCCHCHLAKQVSTGVEPTLVWLTGGGGAVAAAGGGGGGGAAAAGGDAAEEKEEKKEEPEEESDEVSFRQSQSVLYFCRFCCRSLQQMQSVLHLSCLLLLAASSKGNQCCICVARFCCQPSAKPISAVFVLPAVVPDDQV